MVRAFNLLVLAALLLTPAYAQQRIIVRALGGQATVSSTCLLLGCTVIRGLDDPLSQLQLISVPETTSLTGFLSTLLTVPGIIHVEVDAVATISNSRPPIPPELYDSQTGPYFGMHVRQKYVTQPATQIIRLAEAQRTFSVAGTGAIAIIDTGVDPNHPVLRHVLLPGIDYTRGGTGNASEMGDVSQSTAAVVDGVTPSYVNGSTAAVIDQSTAAVVDDPDHAAFGHGTMVAGIVHVVAPNSLILPLKSFGPDGSGYTSDILRAIYRAVRDNARVINMSFSMRSASVELQRAIAHASTNGAICVASAGNDGQNVPVYPAAWNNVLGVASTSNNDVRSSFSNYGETLVTLAAPGEGVITTYPFGTYAAAWGTSFSTSFVSGALALLLDLKPDLSVQQASQAVRQAVNLGPELGSGRLDVFKAIDAARTLE